MSDAPQLELVEVRVDGPVGRLTLDEPDRLNPLGPPMLAEITAAARWLADQEHLKVVVVGGAGRAFCAGADLAAVTGAAQDELTPLQRAAAGRRMADAVEAIGAVTVARIQGHCLGGGVVLASACDLRVAGRGAGFALPEVDLGIPLTWGGIPRLVREIGPGATRDLVLTCRRIDADEALRLGLVQRVVADDDLDAEVESLVASLAAKATVALRSTIAHVDAVTASAAGPSTAWADDQVLVGAQHDPEAIEAAAAALERLRRR